MKFRIDFVTNSSSTSYVTAVIGVRDVSKTGGYEELPEWAKTIIQAFFDHVIKPFTKCHDPISSLKELDMLYAKQYFDNNINGMKNTPEWKSHEESYKKRAQAIKNGYALYEIQCGEDGEDSDIEFYNLISVLELGDCAYILEEDEQFFGGD